MQYQYLLFQEEAGALIRITPPLEHLTPAYFPLAPPTRDERPDFCRLMQWLGELNDETRATVHIAFPDPDSDQDRPLWRVAAAIYAHFTLIGYSHEAAKIARQLAFEADNHAFNATAFAIGKSIRNRRLHEKAKDSAQRAAKAAAAMVSECEDHIRCHTKYEPDRPAMPILRAYHHAAQECAAAAAQSVASIKDRA